MVNSYAKRPKAKKSPAEESEARFQRIRESGFLSFLGLLRSKYLERKKGKGNSGINRSTGEVNRHHYEFVRRTNLRKAALLCNQRAAVDFPMISSALNMSRFSVGSLLIRSNNSAMVASAISLRGWRMVVMDGS